MTSFLSSTQNLKFWKSRWRQNAIASMKIEAKIDFSVKF